MADSVIFTTPVSSALLPVDIIKQGSVTGVNDNIETTIMTHTFLGNQTVGDIQVSGSEYAKFIFYINTVKSFVIRSGPMRQANLFLQRPLNFSVGDVLDIKVIHYYVGVTADFDVTLLGI